VSTIAVTIKSDLVGLGEITQDSSADSEGVRALANYLEACAGGNAEASIDVQTSASDPVAASGTITLASCVTDTVTIGGVTFTGTGSPSTEVEFETDGNDTADAAALAAKINAHSTLSKVVSATSSAGVVTVTCLVKGVVGNFITMSETGSTITLSGAALSGGTGGATTTAKTYSCGL
jgi:phage tail sheath gpL-like